MYTQFLSLIIIFLSTDYTFNFGYRLHKEVKDRNTRILTTGVFLGLYDRSTRELICELST